MHSPNNNWNTEISLNICFCEKKPRIPKSRAGRGHPQMPQTQTVNRYFYGQKHMWYDISTLTSMLDWLEKCKHKTSYVTPITS